MPKTRKPPRLSIATNAGAPRRIGGALSDFERQCVREFGDPEFANFVQVYPLDRTSGERIPMGEDRVRLIGYTRRTAGGGHADPICDLTMSIDLALEHGIMFVARMIAERGTTDERPERHGLRCVPGWRLA
jgi:hypothetical protein